MKHGVARYHLVRAVAPAYDIDATILLRNTAGSCQWNFHQPGEKDAVDDVMPDNDDRFARVAFGQFGQRWQDARGDGIQRLAANIGVRGGILDEAPVGVRLTALDLSPVTSFPFPDVDFDQSVALGGRQLMSTTDQFRGFTRAQHWAGINRGDRAIGQQCRRGFSLAPPFR